MLHSKKNLRVLSYNIHKGMSTGNSFVLDEIRASIRKVHADLVLLQEVLGHGAHPQSIQTRPREAWPKQPQFEFLADQLWPHTAYGRNAIYTSGHHGNAILSRHAFHFWENLDVSTNRFEQRGILHGIVTWPGLHRPLHAICLHLGLFESERKSQIKRLAERIESHVPHSDPLIIAGDFNDWRQKTSRYLADTLKGELEVREAFREHQGIYAKTFPSWFPALRLDRIYYRGLELETVECLKGEPWSQLSDHLPISAVFRI